MPSDTSSVSMAEMPLRYEAVKMAPLSLNTAAGKPQVALAFWKVRTTTRDVAVTNTFDATHSRECSSIMFRTSTLAPSARTTCGASLCHNSLVRSEIKRTNDDRRRLWGRGVTNPRAYKTLQ